MPGPDGPTGWEELTDGVLVAAQPHGAPTWFPCNDRMADKATYRVAVRTDPGYRVVSNGALTAQRRVGRRVEWVHEQHAPMATYLATLQIGRYALERQASAAAPVALAAPPARMPAARAAFADQPRMLEAFVRALRALPLRRLHRGRHRRPARDPAGVQTLSTFGSNHLSRDWEVQRLIAHELAHQWFGNAVTAASLQRHLAARGLRLLRRVAVVGGPRAHDGAGGGASATTPSSPGCPQDLVLTDPGARRTFDDRVYKRGALTLHALRRAVGDEAFFALLRTLGRHPPLRGRHHRRLRGARCGPRPASTPTACSGRGCASAPCRRWRRRECGPPDRGRG